MLDDRYVAGLFDGEGCIMINTWQKPNSIHRRYNLHVSLGVTYLPIVKALKTTYGGSIHVNRHSARNSKHRDQFNWVIGSAKAAVFLRRIVRYLHIKRDEAELGLELQDSIDKWRFKLGNHARLHPRRDEIFAYRDGLRHRLSELKHRTFSI